MNQFTDWAKLSDTKFHRYLISKEENFYITINYSGITMVWLIDFEGIHSKFGNKFIIFSNQYNFSWIYYDLESAKLAIDNLIDKFFILESFL